MVAPIIKRCPKPKNCMETAVIQLKTSFCDFSSTSVVLSILFYHHGLVASSDGDTELIIREVSPSKR